jgi:hypothetical protein
MMSVDRVKRVAMLPLSSDSTLRPLAKEKLGKEIEKVWASHALPHQALLQPRTLWRLGESFTHSILHLCHHLP